MMRTKCRAGFFLFISFFFFLLSVAGFSLFFFCFAKLQESRKGSLRFLKEHNREVACNIPWVIPQYKESRAGMWLVRSANCA